MPSIYEKSIGFCVLILDQPIYWILLIFVTMLNYPTLFLYLILLLLLQLKFYSDTCLPNHLHLILWLSGMMVSKVIPFRIQKNIRSCNEIYFHLINEKKLCFSRDQHWSKGETLIAMYSILRKEWGSTMWLKEIDLYHCLPSAYCKNHSLHTIRFLKNGVYCSRSNPFKK